MRDTPKLREYIRRLQVWRDSYEKGLDARPRLQQLDQGGCNLIEFHHTKFDDVEIPGQYVLVSLLMNPTITTDWASTSITPRSWSRSLASTQRRSSRAVTATVSAASRC